GAAFANAFWRWPSSAPRRFGPTAARTGRPTPRRMGGTAPTCCRGRWTAVFRDAR
ncbi:unnamed protein product, partial [Mycena citricolor]